MSNTALKLKVSLTALDDMLHDFFTDHDGNDKLTDDLRALVETAQRNITTAKGALLRQAINDARPEVKADAQEVSKRLSVQERWMIRHVGLRTGFDASLLGNNASRLVDLELLTVVDGLATLTDLGNTLNELWKTRR